MRKPLLALTVLLSAMLHGQTAIDLNLGSVFSVDGSTTPPTYTFSWWGKSDRHYIVESTPDLFAWSFMPDFNPTGTDAVLGVQFTTDASRYFFRAIQFDPSDISGLADTDTDGLPDKWELYQFGNLSRNGTGHYDDDGLTDLEEFQLGLNPKVNEVTSKITLFTYDAIGRLTHVSGNNNAVTFTLDAEGNITQAQ